MSGNGTNADDELPKLDDDDEGAESTVAMEAPAIPNGAPLPVSQPPPPLTTEEIRAPSPPLKPAIPLPSAKSSAVMPPRPPPPTRTTPSAPLSPRGPLPPSANRGGPLPPSRLAVTQVSPQAPPVRPPEASVTDTGILNATTADPQDVEDDDDDDDRDDGPTITTDPGAMIGVGDPQMFEIDDAATRAAAAATDSRRSPLASTGFAHSPLPQPAQEKPKEEDEAATVAVPKDVIERVRANPKAVLAEEAARAKQAEEIPSIGEEEEESTRAVPRDELLRQQDAHVVVGEDAMGDEATVAVAPEHNSANMALGGPGGPMPPQPGPGGASDVPAFPPPPLGFPGPGPQPGMAGGYPGQQRPMNMPPPQQGPTSGPWQAHAPPSHPMGPGGMSSGVMPTAMPAGGQFPPNTQPIMGQQGQPPRMGVVPAQPPPQQGWMQPMPPQHSPAKSSKISGQVILLVIVGAVCLAIFITGIVLFATTKF